MGTEAIGTVPVGLTLEGWTSCCEGAVTYAEATLVCKGCWHEVEMVALDRQQAVELDKIVRAVLFGEMTADAGVARQRALLAEVI